MSLALDPVESSGALVGHVDGLRGRLRPRTPIRACWVHVITDGSDDQRQEPRDTRQRRAIIPLTINNGKETDDVRQ